MLKSLENSITKSPQIPINLCLGHLADYIDLAKSKDLTQPKAVEFLISMSHILSIYVLYSKTIEFLTPFCDGSGIYSVDQTYGSTKDRSIIVLNG